MTSEEIRCDKCKFGEAMVATASMATEFWLREIAYQLAVMNESNASRPRIEVERSEVQKRQDQLMAAMQIAQTQGQI